MVSAPDCRVTSLLIPHHWHLGCCLASLLEQESQEAQIWSIQPNPPCLFPISLLWLTDRPGLFKRILLPRSGPLTWRVAVSRLHWTLSGRQGWFPILKFFMAEVAQSIFRTQLPEHGTLRTDRTCGAQVRSLRPAPSMVVLISRDCPLTGTRASHAFHGFLTDTDWRNVRPMPKPPTQICKLTSFSSPHPRCSRIEIQTDSTCKLEDDVPSHHDRGLQNNNFSSSLSLSLSGETTLRSSENSTVPMSSFGFFLLRWDKRFSC